MKKLFLLLIVTLPVLVIAPGCATTSTPTTPVYTVEKAHKVAAVLTSTARSGVVIAYTKDPNSTAYMKAVATGLATFVTSSDMSPGALQVALSATSIKELKTIEGQLALNTAIGIYEVFWGDMVRDNVSANVPAKVTIQGLIDGLLLGVQDVEDIKANKAAVVPK